VSTANLKRENEISQKEDYTRRGSLFMEMIEEDVPKGKDKGKKQPEK
jgi:hypothetical protein